MTDLPTQALPAPKAPTSCSTTACAGSATGLCSSCSSTIAAPVFTFASLQSADRRAMVERFGGHPDELTSFYVVRQLSHRDARDVQPERRRALHGRRAWLAMEGGGRDAGVPTAIRDRGL